MYKVVFVLLLILPPTLVHAQTPETASAYMDYLSTREQELSKRYMSYISENAHGNRARKLEKKRQELVTEIRKSLNDANRLRPFNGDASLRDAYKRYWDIMLKLFNEDYEKIVNMEEIAEQSYDKMEAYLMAQEKAGDVLSQAQEQIEPIFKAFAATNKIRLVDGEDSKLSKKLRQSGAVSNYYHQLYLIMFKNIKQDAYVVDAFNRKDINAVEQNRNTLAKFSQEGLAKLDTMRAFQGDASLVTACRKALEFYKNEALVDIPLQSEFLVKSNEFEKMKKAFDAKPAAKRTQADVDNYNKAVNELNETLTGNNKSIVEVNKNRQKVMDSWDNAVDRFMEQHIPRSK